MAFKMKGSPMRRNFPSVFEQEEEIRGEESKVSRGAREVKPQEKKREEALRSRKNIESKTRTTAPGNGDGKKLSQAEIEKIKQSDTYKTFDKAGVEPKYTSSEHEANKASNAAIDQQIRDYKKAYTDKHGGFGGSDAEWKTYQEGLKKLQSGYKN